MTDRLTAVDAGFQATLAHAGELVSLARVGQSVANRTAVVTVETWEEVTNTGGYFSTHGIRVDMFLTDWPFSDRPQKLDRITWRGGDYDAFSPGGQRFWSDEEGVLTTWFKRV